MTVYIDQIGELPLYLGLGIEICLAIVLGAMVGFDRERKMKSAGIKTNILICLGATLYTAISLINHDVFSGSAVDPNRVAAQIVSGIGFLGAGAIIQGNGGVTGLTTAASMWVVAAIGMTIGSGHPLIATLFTVTLVVVLRILDPFYRLLKLHNDFYIEITGQKNAIERFSKLLESESAEIRQENIDIVDAILGINIKRMMITMNPKRLKHAISSVQSSPEIKRIHYHYISRTEEKEAYEIFNMKGDKNE